MNNDDLVYDLILKHNVISFDVFDTLLIRHFCNPTDVFGYIEKYYNLPNFKKIRIMAERKARKKSKNEEVTIQEIYDEMKKYKDKIQIEIDVEKNGLSPNPLILKYYNYAKSLKKKIIAISDTYLSANVVEESLNKCGFDNLDRLFVSSTVKKQKLTGNLFLEVINDLKITPDQMVHFGDNPIVDVAPAINIGIAATHIPNIRTKYLSNHKYRKKNIEKYPEISIFTSQLAVRDYFGHGNYWSKIGYEYGGPLCYSYIKWISSVVDNDKEISDVLFIARDGFLLKKIFDKINSSRTTHYIYAPRFLNIVNNIDYDIDHFDAEYQLKIILKKYEKVIDYDHSTILNKTEMKKIIADNYEVIKKESQKELNDYRSYIESNNIGEGKILIVDTITDKFSAQKLISKSIKNECLGAYWVVLLDGILNNKDMKFCSYQKSHTNMLFNWYLTEVMLSSPEAPIIGIDKNKPIYDTNADDLDRKKIFNEISKGIICFCNDMLSQKNRIDVSNDVITLFLNDYLLNPSKEDLHHFDNCYFSYRPDHSDKNILSPFKTRWYDRANNTTIFSIDYYYNLIKKMPRFYVLMKEIKKKIKNEK